MRYVDILIFVFCLNVSLYLMTTIGLHNVMGNAQVMQPEISWISAINETAYTQTEITSTGIQELDYMLAIGTMLWKGIALLADILIHVVMLAPTLHELGVPLDVAIIISSPVYLIYLWGLIQFFTGKSGRDME